MFKAFKRNTGNTHIGNTSSKDYDKLVDAFIHTEQSLKELPELSPDEKVSLEQEVAISHLYNSSRIEGTSLNETRLTKAINA